MVTRGVTIMSAEPVSYQEGDNLVQAVIQLPARNRYQSRATSAKTGTVHRIWAPLCSTKHLGGQNKTICSKPENRS